MRSIRQHESRVVVKLRVRVRINSWLTPAPENSLFRLGKGQVDVRWWSGGRQMMVRWMSGECQVNVRWTSGEHQMNAWWTSDERLVNIRWTPGEHQVNVRWTSGEVQVNFKWRHGGLCIGGCYWIVLRLVKFQYKLITALGITYAWSKGTHCKMKI